MQKKKEFRIHAFSQRPVCDDPPPISGDIACSQYARCSLLRGRPRRISWFS